MLSPYCKEVFKLLLKDFGTKYKIRELEGKYLGICFGSITKGKFHEKDYPPYLWFLTGSHKHWGFMAMETDSLQVSQNKQKYPDALFGKELQDETEKGKKCFIVGYKGIFLVFKDISQYSYSLIQRNINSLFETNTICPICSEEFHNKIIRNGRERSKTSERDPTLEEMDNRVSILHENLFAETRRFSIRCNNCCKVVCANCWKQMMKNGIFKCPLCRGKSEVDIFDTEPIILWLLNRCNDTAMQNTEQIQFFNDRLHVYAKIFAHYAKIGSYSTSKLNKRFTQLFGTIPRQIYRTIQRIWLL